MRTEALDLDIFGSRVRVVCEDIQVSVLLRSVLAHHLVDDPAPIGFVLKAPGRQNNLHALLDRSGFILGRSRSRDDCLAVLLSHLGAFAPPPPDTTRLRMRALLSDDMSAVLAGPPLFLQPAAVERRLEREGFRIVDRLAVDITDSGALQLSHAPWSGLPSTPPIIGHAAPPIGAANVNAVLMPRVGIEEPSRAELVSMLASLGSSSQPREHWLRTADLLASVVRRVESANRTAPYRALGG